MRAIFSYSLRYLCWALVGAALVYLLLCLWILSDSDQHIGLPPIVAPLPIMGGIAVVIVRAIFGMITRYPAGYADRLIAQGIGRFLFGWILGRMAMFVYLFILPWNRDLSHMLWSGWLELAFRLSGALAMVATGWIAFRRHGRFLLPISWLAVFTILTYASVVAWLSYHKEVSHLLNRIFL